MENHTFQTWGFICLQECSRALQSTTCPASTHKPHGHEPCRTCAPCASALSACALQALLQNKLYAKSLLRFIAFCGVSILLSQHLLASATKWAPVPECSLHAQNERMPEHISQSAMTGPPAASMLETELLDTDLQLVQPMHTTGLDDADPLRLRGHLAVQQREQVVAGRHDIRAGGNDGCACDGSDVRGIAPCITAWQFTFHAANQHALDNAGLRI